MADYKIRILTEGDVGALKQTQQALDGTNKAATGLKKTLDEANQSMRDSQQPAVAAAAAGKKLGDSVGDAGGKVNGFFTALKKVGNNIPGFQFALASLTNVWVLLAAAIVFAVDKFNKWNESILKEEARRKKVFEDLRREIEAYSEAINQAKLDTEEFNRSIEDAKNQGETPTQEGARATAATKRRFAGARQRASAQMQLELDRVGTREARGDITPEQADRERAQIQSRYAREGTQNDLNEQAELAGIARRTAAAEAGRADSLRSQAPGAQDAVVQAKLARAEAAKRLKAAMDYAGLDEKLTPIEGGRFATLESTVPTGIDSYTERQRIEFEKKSLRLSVIEQQRQLGEADLGVASAQANLSRVRGGALSAAQAAGAAGATAAEAGRDFESASRLSRDLAPLTDAAASEKEAASSIKEAARVQKEAAASLLEVMRNLGREADNLRSRSRSSAASGE